MGKRTRITLTSVESASPVGKRLIDLILDCCHDGKIDIREVAKLHAFLVGANSELNAIAFLRAVTREIMGDDCVEPAEAYRLRRAFERVVPKEVRGVVQTHLEDVGLPPFDEEEDQPAWRQDPCTPAQIEYIVALGGNVRAGITKGEASDLIETLLEQRPPTPRQVMLMRFFNRLDLLAFRKEQVSVWIDQLFADHPVYERAWSQFKLQSQIGTFDVDPSVVPIGAWERYV